MFKRIFGSRAEKAPEMDPRLAAAALLVEASLTDGIYADIESDRIVFVLRESFEIGEAAARDVLKDAETIAETAVDAHRFTKIVKTLPETRRAKLIEGLYYVALADGERCPFEDAFIRHIASLLHIEDVSRAQARRRAEARHAGEN